MKLSAAFVVLLLLCIASASADTFGSGANLFDIEFVAIGNPGNSADTTGNPNPAGAVPYTYRMGKFESSRDMVTKANSVGGLGITLDDMTPYGGNGASRPATGLSWNESARFVNWLNTSEGFTPAYKFTTQPGDVGYNANADIQLWTNGDAGFNAANRFRNSLAHYFLPSVDEWYKAAYYDPSANGGIGGYWNYPYGNDSAPVSVASSTLPNTAVFDQPLSQGPADITQAGGLSPYGIMGMGGNVWDWEETEFDLVNNSSSSARAIRGGLWIFEPDFLQASVRNNVVFPTIESFNIGIRVASIPQSASTGDFDNDGDVDGRDFLIWQRGFGISSGATLVDGDSNEDGDVDADDLAVWQDQFSEPGHLSGLAAIPEPTTLALLCLGSICLLRRRCAIGLADKQWTILDPLELARGENRG